MVNGTAAAIISYVAPAVNSPYQGGGLGSQYAIRASAPKNRQPQVEGSQETHGHGEMSVDERRMPQSQSLLGRYKIQQIPEVIIRAGDLGVCKFPKGNDGMRRKRKTSVSAVGLAIRENGLKYSESRALTAVFDCEDNFARAERGFTHLARDTLRRCPPLRVAPRSPT